MSPRSNKPIALKKGSAESNYVVLDVPEKEEAEPPNKQDEEQDEELHPVGQIVPKGQEAEPLGREGVEPDNDGLEVPENQDAEQDAEPVPNEDESEPPENEVAEVADAAGQGVPNEESAPKSSKEAG